MNKVDYTESQSHLAITWGCNGKTEYFRFVERAEGDVCCSKCDLFRGRECSLFPACGCSFSYRKDGKDGNFSKIEVHEYVKAIRLIKQSVGYDPALVETLLG